MNAFSLARIEPERSEEVLGDQEHGAAVHAAREEDPHRFVARYLEQPALDFPGERSDVPRTLHPRGSAGAMLRGGVKKRVCAASGSGQPTRRISTTWWAGTIRV